MSTPYVFPLTSSSYLTPVPTVPPGIPLYCTWPIKKTPLFNTLVRTPSSGRGELRIALMEFPLWNFEMDITYLPGDATGIGPLTITTVNNAALGQTVYNGTITGGGNNSYVGNFFTASLFSHSVNNGFFLCSASTTTSITLANAAGVADTTGVVTANTYWQQLVNFFSYVQGAGMDWLYYDPFHNTATNQVIADGDGTTTKFSMIWTLVSDGAQELIQNFVNAPLIYINGVLQSSSTYTIDTFGTITFNTPPGNTLPISWSGQFFYRCHFLDDFWQDLQENWFQAWTVKLKFRSVLL